MKVKLNSGKLVTGHNANGVQGHLCKSSKNDLFFRVYKENREFQDYEIIHDDSSITIDKDALASFYEHDGDYWIDHSPSILGYEKQTEK